MDDRVDLKRAAQVIRRLDPDLVALQEIDSQTTRTDRIDQAQRLGELTGMHAMFGGFMDYREGQYGMALLSRSPIEEATNHRLPDGPEPRTALTARVRLGDDGPEVVFVSIHLYRSAEERLAEDSLTFPQLLIPPTPICLLSNDGTVEQGSALEEPS